MADEKIIFSMNGVGKILPHNNRVILKDIYLSFFYGAKIGIIGLNGSGKSTLLKIIAGVEKSYRGEVVWAPGYSVGYLEQEPQMDPEKTVLEVVQEGVQEMMDILAEYSEISAKFMEPMSDEQMNALIERQGERTELIEHGDGWELDAKLERAMDALQCPPADALVGKLSGGERRRVALCRLLLRQPDVLLLDEPTNALDPYNRRLVIRTILSLPNTKLIASHDLDMILDTCTRVLLLSNGRLVADGPAEEILRDRALLEANRMELPLRFAR
jgi:ATPase subunit of ABC transporter with duplicated ATPase domains